MLVVSRKRDEKLLLRLVGPLADGEVIELVVVRIAGGVVRIGLQAPAGVVIVRSELEGTPRPCAAR